MWIFHRKILNKFLFCYCCWRFRQKLPISFRFWHKWIGSEGKLGNKFMHSHLPIAYYIRYILIGFPLCRHSTTTVHRRTNRWDTKEILYSQHIFRRSEQFSWPNFIPTTFVQKQFLFISMRLRLNLCVNCEKRIKNT